LWSFDQARIAFEVNTVRYSETIRPSLPRRAISSVSSRATRQPEIEVSGSAARNFARHVADSVEHTETPGHR